MTMWGKEPDRYWTNDDGQTFEGYDDKEAGETTWYSSDGDLDSVTKIPDDDTQEWDDWENGRL